MDEYSDEQSGDDDGYTSDVNDGGGDDIDDDYGVPRQKVKVKPAAKATNGKCERSIMFLLNCPAFPARRERSDSSDEDYASKHHKRKVTASSSTPQSDAWRRGAAKKIVSYDEANVDYGLEESGDEAPAVEEGEVDEIDLVLSHSRDEDRINDPVDLPHENLRFHIKWKGYSHIHNTDELYSFLKTFRGIKKVDNYITKVWQPEQNFDKLSREEFEQVQIDKERVRELQASYKVVERVLAEQDNKFLCKWTSALSKSTATDRQTFSTPTLLGRPTKKSRPQISRSRSSTSENAG